MASGPLTRSRKGWPNSQPLLLIALAVVALYFCRDIFIPLAMALTFNFLLAPVVMRVERLRLGRVTAVILVMAAASAVAVGIGWIVGSQVIGVVNDLPNYRDNIHDKIVSIHAPAGGPVGRAINSIKEIGEEVSGEPASSSSAMTPPSLAHFSRLSRRAREAQEREDREKAEANPKPMPVTVVQAPESERAYLRELLLPVLRPLGTLGMVVIFTIYMLVKREDLRNRLLLLAGMGRMSLMSQALNDAAERISSYLGMNVLVNASYGVVYAGGLYLLHVPNATLWGVLIGILRLVPYIGTLIAGAATLIFTLAVFPGWWHPLLVLVLFGVLEIAVSNFIEPWLYGRNTGISAFALVMSALVWTLLWGWAGLVLSTPLTVCLIVMGRYVPQLSFLYILLGDQAELSPEAGFYERLLAMDQVEAHAIADRFLETRNAIQLYDEVVLPALSLAEQDRHKGALDEARTAFLFQSTTELIAELTDYGAGLTAPVECDEGLTKGRCAPIVFMPASDQADEIAATMLAQLLEQRGHKTMLLPAEAISPEILSRLGEEQETTVCISALPPFAFVHARTLCQTVRRHLPKNRILVGLWRGAGDPEKIRERFGAARPDAVVTTLREALLMIQGGAWPGYEPALPDAEPLSSSVSS
ncbi:AI-2E family transporter [Paracidobacterium acidisoli]|uniref:AI-2E family transporter n=1 Tax=Paracidobacterium acidisoli TaxID=2303751 RepID=A0A372INX7_9BACT|nr:AI-2E family transporter [Paracidobacterium acidisoli]MBT9330961.1 AI-2E family transporter [Paracidobacterium acidisoli]